MTTIRLRKPMPAWRRLDCSSAWRWAAIVTRRKDRARAFEQAMAKGSGYWVVPYSRREGYQIYAC